MARRRLTRKQKARRKATQAIIEYKQENQTSTEASNYMRAAIKRISKKEKG
jgi:hypothetical protein